MINKKQILAIHGGEVFSSYDQYVEFLKSAQIDLEQKKSWRSTLPEALGEEFEVILPQMPNKLNAKYHEWKIWFEKYFPFLAGNIILVGHSLGAIFIAKYLSEEAFPTKIKATFLIAAPYTESDFSLDSLKKFGEQGGEIFLYHSNDDPVVPFSEFEKYQKALPKAQVIIFEDRKHFNQEQFPELVEAIKSL